MISIHALREEGDDTTSNTNDPNNISIHALREEGDAFRARVRMCVHAYFNPRPPRGGRP